MFVVGGSSIPAIGVDVPGNPGKSTAEDNDAGHESPGFQTQKNMSNPWCLRIVKPLCPQRFLPDINADIAGSAG